MFSPGKPYKPNVMKHYSLFGPLISYEEHEVFSIRPQEPSGQEPIGQEPIDQKPTGLESRESELALRVEHLNQILHFGKVLAIL